MKESTKEDLGNHFGLELYADGGNVMGVATAVGYAGKLLSFDPHQYRVPTLSVLREGKMFHCDFGKRWNGSAESKNLCQPKEGVPPKAQGGKAMLSVAKTQCVESSTPVFAARVLLQ